MKRYDSNKESPYLMYKEIKSLYGWAMSQKLSADGFKWRKDLFRFDKEFIREYNEYSDKGFICYSYSKE